MVRVTPTRKHLVVAASVLVHVGLLALLLRVSPHAPEVAEVGAMTVSLAPGEALASTSPQPSTPAKARSRAGAIEVAETPPPPPTDIEPQYVDVAEPDADAADDRDPVNDPVALSVSAAATNASGETCQMTAWLQQALQADPQVQAAMLRIPRPARSVANALMLWDGDWVEPPMQTSQSVAALRAALVAGIRAAPVACQFETIRGPELISLTEGPGATILAVGSGEWRWAQLLEAADPSITRSAGQRTEPTGSATPTRAVILWPR